MHRQPSLLGRWLSRVRERLVMKLVCCAPASVVFEIELEDEDFQRPEDTTVKQLPVKDPLLRQKSASIAPVSRPLQRLQSADREHDIPTNEELERLPIDLSFVLRDEPDEEEKEALKHLLTLRKRRAARVIQRRWRQFPPGKRRE
ncbi:hypothetical protein PINS_up010010 [Pythium insidiosum]|nr:hypothetical protein PINS_up010010 [Pythium insidiosum]